MNSPRSLVKCVSVAWLVAGSLDLADALVVSHINGISPGRVLRYIASGLLGRQARTGGFATSLLGLSMHYAIALAWTILYVAAARRLPWLRRYAVSSGLVYGLIIFGVMNYVVLPRTRIGQAPHFTTATLANAVLALVFCIGLPVALIERAQAPQLPRPF